MTRSQLLDRLFDKPALYVGYESISLIKAFVDGFEYAHILDGGGEEDALYSGFTEWIAQRFEIRSSHGWSHIIEFMGVSDSESFRLAKELWEEYKSQNIAELVG